MSISVSPALSMPSLGAASANKPAGARSPAEEFLEFAHMSPAERMRALILAKMGLTEEQVQALDSDARKKIEEKIREEIKKQVENSLDKRSGMITDISA